MQMEWTDPALAFNPDDCDCGFKTFIRNTFNDFVKAAEGRWPDFTLQNQQGNRWTQNRVAVVWSSGRALYFERFTTNFQVDFDFRQFPFDTQEFIMRVDALFPEEFFIFTDLEGYSEISTEHGEDEFATTGSATEVTSEQASTQSTTLRFTFSFEAPRHVNYSVFQICIPILLIIGVSWVTFFLRDYGRRIEVASANLLLFIAFSRSLADNYPRLGYLTFLDVVMAIMSVVNALVVAYKVWLKRVEMEGDREQADSIDRMMDWAYPAAYVVLFGIAGICSSSTPASQQSRSDACRGRPGKRRMPPGPASFDNTLAKVWEPSQGFLASSDLGDPHGIDHGSRRDGL